MVSSGHVEYNTSYKSELAFIADILKTYNLRASEALNISAEDCNYKGFVIVKGCKGSSNIIIRDRIFVSKLQVLAGMKKQGKLFSCTYNQLYYYVKIHYGSYQKSSKNSINNAVTHQFRYKNCKQADNFQDKKNILGHLSNRNVNYYNK